MAPMTLPPGFRFHPSDDELVGYYLDRKISGQTIELEIIPEVDLYKCEPWDLPDKSYLPSKDMEWYFFSPRDGKYPNGLRTNRATRAGYWKATGKDRVVHSHRLTVGMKKTLVYYSGRAPHGIRSNWVMHEYRLVESSVSNAISTLKDAYALCRVFKKTIHTSKTQKEQNGCSEKDSLWSSDEHILGEGTICNDTSQQREIGEENWDLDCSNFPSDTSSSEITQGTPINNGTTDDPHAFFATDEANSSINAYSFSVNSSSDLTKDITMPMTCSRLQNQLSYPPLLLEDFPQMDTIEEGLLKPERIDGCMIYDKYYSEVNMLYTLPFQDYSHSHYSRLNENHIHFDDSSLLNYQ